MEFNKSFLHELLMQAAENPRLRQNLDLRTSREDCSQRMLNALLPGTVVPIHRHRETSETVVCLCGKMEEIIYEEVAGCGLREVKRLPLSPAEGRFGCQVPRGAWHTVVVLEPSVIFEAKDGAFAPACPEDIWTDAPENLSRGPVAETKG